MLKKQLFTLPLFLGAILLSTGTMNADMDYTVMVNTSSINGTTGSIDFQFNPGVGTFQSANVNVASFNGGSYGGAQSVYGTGVAGGPPPTAISITNVGGQDNEVLDSYTFGNALTFTLDFSGPAVNAPNGTDTAGSLFAFSIFGDAAGTMPVLTSDPNGVALTVAVSDQGVLTPTIVSPDVQLTPEPSSVVLMTAPLVLLLALVMRRRLTCD